MNQRSIYIIVGIGLVVLALCLVAWCPWLDAIRANSWATSDFNDEWKGTADGCGVMCTEPLNKTLFGYKIKILFDCGKTCRFKRTSKIQNGVRVCSRYRI